MKLPSETPLPAPSISPTPSTETTAPSTAPESPSPSVALEELAVREAVEHPISIETPSGVSPGWALTYVITALVVAGLVHHLTARRDRRKASFELQENLVAATKMARDTALERWTVKAQHSRQVLIHRTNTDIQRVGSIARRLSLESDILFLFKRSKKIDLDQAVHEFRSAITTEAFLDKNEGGTSKRREEVEQAAGVFISSSEAAIINWMR